MLENCTRGLPILTNSLIISMFIIAVFFWIIYLQIYKHTDSTLFIVKVITFSTV